MVDIYHILEEQGHTPMIAYGRQEADKSLQAWKFGSSLDMGMHVLSTFFKGEHGFSSKGQTEKLIQKIKQWNPDVIHLHNIHGFILQVELLFSYLKQAKKPVVWTLHDCWAYTGHCAFYDYNACEGWKSGCKSCKEYRKTYPYALFCNRTASNFERKKRAFTGVENLTLVMPSLWLKKEAEKSFLKDYPMEVIPNGIDLQKFHPMQSSLRNRLQLEGKFVILGVANVWERRKGLEYFVELAAQLPKQMQIILIGLSKKQIKGLPSNILGIERTSSIEELAEYYAMANVFVNATLEDNFPTTNLEALACGTPVITFQTGGSPESVEEGCGYVVEKGNTQALLEAIYKEEKNPCDFEKCRKKAEEYEKNKRFQEYIDLYLRLIDRGV